MERGTAKDKDLSLQFLKLLVHDNFLLQEGLVVFLGLLDLQRQIMELTCKMRSCGPVAVRGGQAEHRNHTAHHGCSEQAGHRRCHARRWQLHVQWRAECAHKAGDWDEERQSRQLRAGQMRYYVWQHAESPGTARSMA